MYTVSRRRGFRGVRRAGRAIGGATIASLKGLTGFVATTNYAETASPGGINGVASGFWVACLFSIQSQAVGSATRHLVSKALAVTPVAGWLLRTSGTNTGIGLAAANGVGTAVATPAFAIPAGHVGKAVLVVGVHTGTSLQLYVDRLAQGAPAAITGYTPQVGAMRMGASPAGASAVASTTIFGVAGGHAVPTLAQVQAYYDQVKAANGILGAMPGVTTQSAWNVLGATGTVPDSIDADPMTITTSGALSLVTQTPPVFSW